MKRIAVFCGSSQGFSSVYREAAEEMGIYFARKGIEMVFGGGKIGLMGAMADALIKEKGSIIGVIPGLLRHEEVEHNEVTKMIVTKSMSKRKVRISKLVDGYLALPGGFGTLDEIFEALTLSQLGIENKPVGILNTNGYFNPLLDQLDVMVREGFLKASNKNMLLVGNTVNTLMEQMLAYRAPQSFEARQKIVR